MACPMRFILAGISAFIALCIFWKRSSSDASKDSSRVRTAIATKMATMPWYRTVLDMFTGRFLVDVYKAARD
eukprot:jgi/Picre1/28262/NNA_003668.t1